MGHSVFTIAQRPELEESAHRVGSQVWPVFMLHDPVTDLYWERLFGLSDFQIVVCDTEDRIVGAGNIIPFLWDGTLEGLSTGWDTVLEKGFVERERGGVCPTDLSALLAIVATEHQGRSLGRTILDVMRTTAAEHGLRSLLAPVRPTMKSHYLYVPMEDYVQWTRGDGKLFDPWLRVHASLGARSLGIAHNSMENSGKISDSREWTGMEFPHSGEYLVPGALRPVEIDLEKDLGVYKEPNVWMRHAIPSVGER